jgi:cytidylate kinase
VTQDRPKWTKADIAAEYQAQLVRDHRDKTRAEAPLCVAPGARVLDSTGMSINGIVDIIAGWAMPHAVER